jgi:hypothetical protein
MEYHPGGIEELMRGAGQDGTLLFDEVSQCDPLHGVSSWRYRGADEGGRAGWNTTV